MNVLRRIGASLARGMTRIGFGVPNDPVETLDAEFRADADQIILREHYRLAARLKSLEARRGMDVDRIRLREERVDH